MDKDGLIPIGRFAKLTDLAPRYLRKLDERGLLRPVYVDEDSKYRYYSREQTRLAGLMHLGRQLGMTVDQMDELVAAFDRGELRPYLKQQRADVAARLAEQSRLLRLLDLEIERDGLPLTYEIALKDVPAQLVMSSAGSIPRGHPHDPWALESALRRTGARASVHIAHHGQTPDPHPVILYEGDLAEADEHRFEVCFPVPSRLPDGPGVTCKELPAARVAFTTFLGPYDTIWNGYVELLAWVADRGYRIAGPLREMGIVAEEDDADPRDWVTELAVPVA